MKSNYENVKNFRKSVKLVAVASMGGKCQCCGYDRCITALELHHINPSEKEISFSTIHSWDVLYNELTKAILVCANCHRELHYNIIDLPLLYAKFDETIADGLRSEASHKASNNHVNIEERIEQILNSGIDFSKKGWGSVLGKLLHINSANANLWVKKNMKEFHLANCYKY